ncbi:MAG: hypothetical protein ACPGOV_05180 [Magnetovibrionaceae bacterium]
MKKTFLAGIVAACLVPSGAMAEGSLDLSGSVGVETRWFTQDRQFSGQMEGVQNSVTLEPELRYRFDDGAQRINLLPFARLDSRDARRTHLDLREAYWTYIADDWQLLVGANKVFWGVTESQHLVDIVNQTDVVEGPDGEDKLGQPMIQYTRFLDAGDLSFFVMPYFRERTFPGAKGRLRAPQPVDFSEAQYESGLDEFHPDFAIRFAGFEGDIDYGLSLFRGTSREARLVLSEDETRRVPTYDIITQAGLDLQYTSDAWLWKLETIVREGQGNVYGAGVGGFEYTLYQVFSSDADIGLLAEYHLDGRDQNDAPSNIFNDDLFLGTRLTLNDVQDSSLLAGVVMDRKDQSYGFSVEAERRIGDSYTVELEARFLTAVAKDDPLYGSHRDDFVALRVFRNF